MNTKFALIPRLIILTVLTIALAIGHPANADFIDQEVESAVIGASSRNLIAQQSSRHPSLRLNFANPGAPEAGSVLSINDVTLLEGDSGTANAVFTVTLTPVDLVDTVTVDYTTANDTAIQPGDYILTSGTLTFNPGETSQPISVPVVGDTLDEIDETFFVNLNNPTNATITDNQGVGTITDDDLPPTLSINDVALLEGNSGTTNATFTVTLSAVSSKTITVSYATADNSAIQPGDYISTSGTLTFNPGVTSQPISVPVVGDTLDEANETFFVNLSNPTNATILDPQGQGTITDDDDPPTLSINDVAVPEGNSGSTNATFTVTLSAVSSKTITVNYATADNSAIQPGDYTSTSGTLTFNPGVTSQPISVPVLGDTLAEANETFFVNLSTPTNATILDPQGQGTIADDDAAPTLSINDVIVLEGNSGTTNATFTVTLSAASGQTITVNYATANNSAIQPGDYTLTSGTLTFNPGNISLPIPVPVVGDTLAEANETFFVNLSTPTNATILDPQGLGTITDDDAAPTLSIDDVVVLEGNSGTTNATFTVSLSAASGQTINVSYATADNTAVQPGDYTPTSGTLTFNPGNTSLPIAVPVLGDVLDEIDETFFVNLSNPVNATILDPQGLGTITDDDGSPTLSINDVSVLEGNSGTTNATFIVSLSAVSGQTITVSYATADDTAVQPGDYTLT